MNDRSARQSGQRAPSLRKQRGVALLLFMLVLLVASSTYLIRHADSRVSAQQKRLAKSTQALADAKEALIAYAVQYPGRPGSLPCPDVDYDGQSQIGIEYVGNNCAERLGWFPYRSLDMQELRDDSGAKLWYAVANDYRMFWGGSTPPPLNSETAGTLTVDALTDVIAVIIAPGVAFDSQTRPDGAGTLDAGTDRGEFLEDINADETLEDYVSAAVGDFNDRVMVITRAELMRKVEKRVVGEVMGSLQAFRAAHGAFPWPVTYSDPLVRTEFRGNPGTTEGLLPRHFGDDVGSGFPSTFTVTWSGLGNVSITSMSGTIGVADLINSPTTGGAPVGVSVPAVQGTCYWHPTKKVTTARCRGAGAVTVDMMVAPFGTEYHTYGGYVVTSWTRTYDFTDIRIAVGTFDPSTDTEDPDASSPRTRSLTATTAGGDSQWVVTEEIKYDNAGSEETVTGTGTLDTTSTTVGNLTVSDIYYYLDEETELPSWFVDNNWHRLIYFAAAADYLGGGDGNCQFPSLPTPPTCLALEVFAGTTVATDVGIAVVTAGGLISGQDRAAGVPVLAQYYEDADVASNSFGPTVSYRPRGDAANNDQVQVLRAGVL